MNKESNDINNLYNTLLLEFPILNNRIRNQQLKAIERSKSYRLKNKHTQKFKDLNNKHAKIFYNKHKHEKWFKIKNLKSTTKYYQIHKVMICEKKRIKYKKDNGVKNGKNKM